ncbi:MAG: hypothetical protein EA422_16195 [Gemmatimonadales bacterium]|nr:MAG: hypothetical protein EA422_16195 [Gemmatimonadales bacterium]
MLGDMGMARPGPGDDAQTVVRACRSPGAPLVLLLVVVGLAVLAGCRDILTEPAPAGPASLALTMMMPEGDPAGSTEGVAARTGPAATPGAAFDRADRIRIQLRGTRGTRVDLDQEFQSEGALTRIRLELDLSEDEEMAIAVDLRFQGRPLFEAEGTARMTPGESTEAQLTLMGVVDRIQVSEEPILIFALGDEVALSGQGVFASGQAVPGAVPTWESMNLQVARIVGGNRVEAVSNGEAQVLARVGSLVESIFVRVEQRVATVELEPALLELNVLEMATLTVRLRDSNGNPISPGPPVQWWTTSDPGVARVDGNGRVQAMAPGSAEVGALVEGVTGTAAVVVRELAPPEIVTHLLPDGRVGESYNATLEATGGETPYTWSLDSGSLPAGLTLSPAGAISGTPTADGTFTFTVRVTGANELSDTRQFTLVIDPAPEPPTISTSSLPEGMVGESYGATMEASGGSTPYSWSLASGSLPAGLSLSTGGVISGTPTTAGSRTFTVRVTGANDLSSTRQFTLQISAPPPTGADLGVGFGDEQFSLIPAGTFQMGSESGMSGERPVHSVTLTRSFYMQRTPVTQGQWREIMGGSPSACGDTCPVATVSWNEAQEFIQRLNQRYPGRNYRLPTEAEWEYAARAGTTGDYGGTGVLDDMGWYSGNSGGEAHPVALKQPNAWDLYDMHGNVWEWVQDWFRTYSVEAQTDPTGPVNGTQKVLRGGSHASGADSARSAYRFLLAPTIRSGIVGFRLARTP